MNKKLRTYAAEIFVLFGCACILYGLSKWSLIITWIVGGLMAIVFGVLIAINDAKEKARHASVE